MVCLEDTQPRYYSNLRLESARKNPKFDTLLNILEAVLFDKSHSETFEQKTVLKTVQKTMEFLLPRWNSTYRIVQLRSHLNEPDNKFSAHGGRVNWLLKYLQKRWNVVLGVEENIWPKLNWNTMTIIIFDVIIVKDLAVQKKWWIQPTITKFFDFCANYLMKHSSLWLKELSWIDYIEYAEALKIRIMETENPKQEFPFIRFLVLGGIILFLMK